MILINLLILFKQGDFGDKIYKTKFFKNCR